MARYTGPRLRISRRFNTPVFGSSKYLERKAYPPGQHGQSRRRKATDYALALAEKQKMRFYYGLMEKQFRGVYEKAFRRRGVTGGVMLLSLEMSFLRYNEKKISLYSSLWTVLIICKSLLIISFLIEICLWGTLNML